MRSIIILALVGISYTGFSQRAAFNLHIHDEKIIVDEAGKILVDMCLENHTDSVMIFYGMNSNFRTLHLDADELEPFISRLSAGRVFYLYDLNMKRLKP